MKIGIISDTHGWLDKAVYEHFSECDEIWHAGDIGSIEVLEELEAFKPVRAVFGNCDGYEIRRAAAEHLVFTAGEKKSVTDTHWRLSGSLRQACSCPYRKRETGYFCLWSFSYY